MRIRTFLAAAAAPLALGAILLGTAGRASAATVTPAPQHAYVQVQNDPDSNVTGTNWANDNISRFFTVRQTTPGVYDVQTSDYGVWNAIPGAAAPLDATGQTHMGSEHGWFTGGADFTVSSPNGGASQANLLRALGGHFTVSNGASTTALVQDLFPAGATVTSAFNTWSWTYHYGNEVMVQQSAAPNYTDTPTKIFTNGG
jgi:hypothetical protein